MEGRPSIRHRMSLVYSAGVAKGRFSVNRFVELVSTTPAKIFGLYPRKGTVAVGSDAELVIFDPNREHTISAQTHHMRVDYSMFEGIKVKGMPDTVLSRGHLLVEGEQFHGKAGQGSFLKRAQTAGCEQPRDFESCVPVRVQIHRLFCESVIPVTLIAIVALLLLVALAASYIPARGQ